MSIRQTGQLSLADGLAKQPSRLSETLERVQSLIDWQQIDTLLAPLRASRYGAPGYPPLLMLKALLLQQWYSLSDPGLEEALIDRLSFRRFCGAGAGGDFAGSLDDQPVPHGTGVSGAERSGV